MVAHHAHVQVSDVELWSLDRRAEAQWTSRRGDIPAFCYVFFSFTSSITRFRTWRLRPDTGTYELTAAW